MSTQQVRNQINSQIDSVIESAKEQVKNEAKKKIAELKQKIPTPQELIKKLQAEINTDSCSDRGLEKYEKIYNGLMDKLNSVDDITSIGLETLENVENQLSPIIEQKGAIGKIQKFAETIQPILQLLQIAILAAPIALAAFTGPAASGTGIDASQKKRDDAAEKVAAYVALIASIPLIILFYVNEAKKVTRPLELGLVNMRFIKSEVSKLKAFLSALKLQHQEGCTILNDSQNTTTGGPNDPTGFPPIPNGPTPLQEYLNLIKDYYKDVYDVLLQTGDEKAIERVFVVRQGSDQNYSTAQVSSNFLNTTLDYNISFKVKNISEIDPNNPTTTITPY